METLCEALEGHWSAWGRWGRGRGQEAGLSRKDLGAELFDWNRFQLEEEGSVRANRTSWS